MLDIFDIKITKEGLIFEIKEDIDLSLSLSKEDSEFVIENKTVIEKCLLTYLERYGGSKKNHHVFLPLTASEGVEMEFWNSSVKVYMPEFLYIPNTLEDFVSGLKRRAEVENYELCSIADDLAHWLIDFKEKFEKFYSGVKKTSTFRKVNFFLF